MPAGADVQVADDGTVMVQVGRQKPSQAGKLKLVDPDMAELKKGDDGLMRMKEGGEAPVSDSVRVVQGAVEGSNVNVVESMVGMIEVQRQFEMQMKLLQTAESNEQRASQILSIRG